MYVNRELIRSHGRAIQQDRPDPPHIPSTPPPPLQTGVEMSPFIILGKHYCKIWLDLVYLTDWNVSLNCIRQAAPLLKAIIDLYVYLVSVETIGIVAYLILMLTTISMNTSSS